MPGTVKKEKSHCGSLKRGENLRVKWCRHFIGMESLKETNMEYKENMVALDGEDIIWVDCSLKKILPPIYFIFYGISYDATLTPTNLLLILLSLIEIKNALPKGYLA